MVNPVEVQVLLAAPHFKMKKLSLFNNSNIDMTKGSVSKSLILFAIPILISDFLQQFYNVVDSLIVGNFVGKQALAAVGETFFLINIFLGIFLGISLGSTVEISRRFGAHDRKNLSLAVDTSIKLTLILAILFTVAGVSLVPTLLKLVGTKPDVYADAKTYLTIYLAGIVAQLFYNTFSAILKAVGDSRTPLIVLAITTVLNIFLDLLFIAVFDMGVAGAAYATIISQAISAIILWFVMNKNEAFDKPIIIKAGLDKDVVTNTLRVGLPYALQRSITSISNTMVMSYVNYFESDATAAYTIYLKIDQFVISSILSIGSATTTFVAQNNGAKKYDRIRQSIKLSFILTFALSIFYAGIICLFRNAIGRAFTDDAYVIAIAANLMVSLCPTHTINAIPQICSAICRGRGDSLGPTIIMTGCYVVIRQIYLALRWKTFKDLMIVVAAYHFTWTICACLMLCYLIIQEKRHLKLEKAC